MVPEAKQKYPACFLYPRRSSDKCDMQPQTWVKYGGDHTQGIGDPSALWSQAMNWYRPTRCKDRGLNNWPISSFHLVPKIQLCFSGDCSYGVTKYKYMNVWGLIFFHNCHLQVGEAWLASGDKTAGLPGSILPFSGLCPHPICMSPWGYKHRSLQDC